MAAHQQPGLLQTPPQASAAMAAADQPAADMPNNGLAGKKPADNHHTTNTTSSMAPGGGRHAKRSNKGESKKKGNEIAFFIVFGRVYVFVRLLIVWLDCCGGRFVSNCAFPTLLLTLFIHRTVSVKLRKVCDIINTKCTFALYAC